MLSFLGCNYRDATLKKYIVHFCHRKHYSKNQMNIYNRAVNKLDLIHLSHSTINTNFAHYKICIDFKKLLCRNTCM